MSAAEMSSSEARAHFSEVVGRAQHAGISTAITSHGKRVAAVVPVDVLDLLEEMEDRALSRLGREARSDSAGTVDHDVLVGEFEQR